METVAIVASQVVLRNMFHVAHGETESVYHRRIPSGSPRPTAPIAERGCLHVFGNSVTWDTRPLIMAIATAGETACPTLLVQSFPKWVGQAVSPACGN